jgi:hypothetical protein
VVSLDDLTAPLRLLASTKLSVVLDDQIVEDLCLLVVHDSLVLPVSRLKWGSREGGLTEQQANYLLFVIANDLEAE